MFNQHTFGPRKARTGSRFHPWTATPAEGTRHRMRNAFAFLVLGFLLLSGAVQAGTGAAADPGRPLDLNRATMDQLEALPGIGAVKAAAILAVRDSRGGFRTMEELESVRGIGPALVARLRPLVVLGSADAQKGEDKRAKRASR